MPACLAACLFHLQGQRAFVSLKAVAEAFPSRPVNMTRAYLKDACDLALRVSVQVPLQLASVITAICPAICPAAAPACFTKLLSSPLSCPRLPSCLLCSHRETLRSSF
jgi:hypothetical protein